MRTKTPQERSLKPDQLRQKRSAKAALQRLRETEALEDLDLYPLPYISINADGSEQEIYVNQERSK